MLAARVAFCARGSDWLVPFVDAVFDANFIEDRDISSEACVGGVLKDIGVEPTRTIAAATTDVQKQLFRAHVDNALASGIFGVPTFAVGDELYWGNDRLDQALQKAVGSEPNGPR